MRCECHQLTSRQLDLEVDNDTTPFLAWRRPTCHPSTGLATIHSVCSSSLASLQVLVPSSQLVSQQTSGLTHCQNLCLQNVQNNIDPSAHPRPRTQTTPTALPTLDMLSIAAASPAAISPRSNPVEAPQPSFFACAGSLQIDQSVSSGEACVCPPVGLASNEHESNSTDAAIALLSLASSKSLVRHARVARVVSSLHRRPRSIQQELRASIQILSCKEPESGRAFALCEALRACLDMRHSLRADPLMHTLTLSALPRIGGCRRQRVICSRER
jgi:hypothetical protein